jgi:hypothetical protein
MSDGVTLLQQGLRFGTQQPNVALRQKPDSKFHNEQKSNGIPCFRNVRISTNKEVEAAARAPYFDWQEKLAIVGIFITRDHLTVDHL